MIEVFVCGEVNYDPNHWPVTEVWEVDADESDNKEISEAWLARQNKWA